MLNMGISLQVNVTRANGQVFLDAFEVTPMPQGFHHISVLSKIIYAIGAGLSKFKTKFPLDIYLMI